MSLTVSRFFIPGRTINIQGPYLEGGGSLAPPDVFLDTALIYVSRSEKKP